MGFAIERVNIEISEMKEIRMDLKNIIFTAVVMAS